MDRYERLYPHWDRVSESQYRAIGNSAVDFLRRRINDKRKRPERHQGEEHNGQEEGDAKAHG